MSRGSIEVVAVRLSEFPRYSKVIYKKGEQLYIRSGEDDFIRGKAIQGTLESACYKWGFYKVDNPPKFRDGQELMDNIGRFSVNHNRIASFSPNPQK